jgi:hypothetical protein
MNAASPTAPATKRRFQFGTRVVFLLIGFAALVAWWARREMGIEERREKLIAELQAQEKAFFQLKPEASWRRHFAAWLRGKPPTPTVTTVSLGQKVDLATSRDVVETFPNAGLTLHLKATPLSREWKDFLAQLETLNTLVILDPLDTTDESLSWLGKLKTKEYLRFTVNGVTDQLLRRLADAKVSPSQILDVANADDPREWSSVTNDGLHATAGFRRLQSLFVGPLVGDGGFSDLRDHTTLEYVGLSGPGFTDTSAETLATLTGLRVLTLRDTTLTDAGIAKAIQGRPMRGLYLRNIILGPQSIAAIAAMGSLVEVELENVPLSSELVTALAKQPLGKLRLEGAYRDADLLLLAPVAPLLSRITLKTPQVTDQGLGWLTNAARLNLLILADTQATQETMKLLSNTKVGRVWLGGPNINAATLTEATRSVKQGNFDLWGDSIDDDSLQGLEPTYAYLTLAGTRVTVQGLRSLKTNGAKISVLITYPDGTAAPLNQLEIEEVKRATGGLVDVSLNAMNSNAFARYLPRAAATKTISQ